MVDPISIILVTIFSAVMSLAVLGSLLRTGIPGVRRWFAASILAVLALVLYALQGHAPPWLTVVGANVALSGAGMVILQGCRQFFGGAPSSSKPEYVAWLVLCAGLLYWTYVEPDIATRIVLVSAFHAYVYGMIGWVVFRARPRARRQYAYRFVSIGAFLGAAGHVGRGLIYGAGVAPEADLLQATLVIMQSTLVSVVFLAWAILTLPWLSIGMVLLAHDRLAERLERLASLDELTGLLIRRAFMAQAEAAVKTAARTGRPLALALVDLDHFKRINDQYGHARGDEVLARFAKTVTANLRAGDVFGRLGGEEFALLCPDTSASDALILLNRLRTLVAQAGNTEEQGGLVVTFSAGVDQYRAGDSLPHLMGRADAALYRAKALGRDRIVIASSREPASPEPAPGLAGGQAA
ncbi:GGDEF domain-containing protein [Pigmentiphaga sp.]|uniref:GGDEF domain-containing protein n=1 Tax=Pigmentiphaga sp. TaxID=1977564 RepID=UPI0025E509BA|nr:GGDEF domain-containing protein [Pigmentiphaga sp.]MBX6318203.1 GGDEF domain-containing protein [Pigmentiphaga sp.]